MLRAVVTIKDLALIGFSTSVCMACGVADSSVGPPLLGPQIEVRYLSALTAQQQNIVAGAVDKWTRALSKDLGDFQLDSPANTCFSGQPRLSESHHNLLLFVSVAEVDGSRGQLAFTQICGVSSRDVLPILSHIRLDRADLDSMEARGVLRGVITHEMGTRAGVQPEELHLVIY